VTTTPSNEQSLEGLVERVSETQLRALRLASEGNLVRWKGGFWALRTEPDKYRGGRSLKRGGPVPERWVGTSTIDSLERRGLLERTFTKDAHGEIEEWRDPRCITEAGRSALSALKDASE
jgi:hypothetical protein